MFLGYRKKCGRGEGVFSAFIPELKMEIEHKM
jgi:hypothetical protein